MICLPVPKCGGANKKASLHHRDIALCSTQFLKVPDPRRVQGASASHNHGHARCHRLGTVPAAPVTATTNAQALVNPDATRQVIGAASTSIDAAVVAAGAPFATAPGGVC